jgi:serine/threonine-protein phosphatase 4 regulatory subunit 2
MLGSTLQSAPSTPLFSPIPFLHDDARRSKSRSPPPTPLALNPSVPPGEGPLEIKAIGLVDEFDDPRPGHMSDHPTALSSVTTLPETTPGPQSRPFLESLEARFVKAEDQMDTGDLPPAPVADSDSMELDEDKENVKA